MLRPMQPLSPMHSLSPLNPANPASPLHPHQHTTTTEQPAGNVPQSDPYTPAYHFAGILVCVLISFGILVAIDFLRCRRDRLARQFNVDGVRRQ